MHWGMVMIDAGYCACIRVLCVHTRILRPRTRVAVKFITIVCVWEVDSLEKLTMSILRYFQKVPSVEPETAEVPAPHGSEEAPIASSLCSYCTESISPTQIASEMCVDVSDYNETGDSIPPAPKRAFIDSAPEYRDVARYVQSSLPISDAEKYQLLTDPFKPGANYKFPKRDNGRAFQYPWLELHYWLVYSKQENGGFCIPCVLFASTGYHGHLHRDIPLDISKVIYEFARRHPRRLQVTDISVD